MRITRRTTIAAAFVVGTAAVLLPAASAVAYISPPVVLLAEPQSPAALVAKGAAVDVPVEYSCTTRGMWMELQVTEKVGKGIASGSATTTVPCDSATHRVLVRAPATPSGKAFTKGTAAVRIALSGCWERNGDYRCGNDSIERTVSIK